MKILEIKLHIIRTLQIVSCAWNVVTDGVGVAITASNLVWEVLGSSHSSNIACVEGLFSVLFIASRQFSVELRLGPNCVLQKN
jgi:hypothetical protein